MKTVPDLYVTTAIDAADMARRVTGRYFRAPLEIVSKQDLSPVTVADREAEQVVRDLILGRHPDHSFLGEETGTVENGDEWRWILDPIDGTKSFATGKPTFGTLVALLHRGAPVLGIIDMVALDERWIGAIGRETTHNGSPCATSSAETLASSSIYATSPDMFSGAARDQFNRLSSACQFRVFGGDCYSYGLLSSGHTELVCEADMNPYDYMALVPVVAGAGGRITDWQGKPLTMHSDGQIIASASPTLHDQALEKLQATA